jgi:cytochrome c-type biogenesis protein CcmH
MKKILPLFLLVLIAAGLWAGAAGAQQATPSDDEVNRIAKQLFCPVCENTPLDVCPTQACAQWRALIRQMLIEGKTEDEIKQYFVDYYGARVLSEPPREGINWLNYIVPWAAVLLGAAALMRALLIMKRKPAVAKAQAAPATDEYLARMEAELKKRK